MPQQAELIPHLFRTEYRKIVSVLIKRFGLGHIEAAEDIASDTFLSAAETWGLKGLPESPTAWLYAVAKNKAKTLLIRSHRFPQTSYDEEVDYAQETEHPEIDLSLQNINDSQLQMMFAICKPSISTESQIALSLRILCGFGIDEIADAFLTNKETINKRLHRAKERLRDGGGDIALPDKREIEQRLDAVLTTLYLLFNEGYYSTCNNVTLRKDLCLEAMRLTYLLTENEATNRPSVNALLALMCFHASRFEARVNQNGEMVLYEDQDERLWSRELIDRGVYFLEQASHVDTHTKYHLEAAIAYWHTNKTDCAEKWDRILQLYNRLLQIEYSPLAALNRTYALSKVHGVAEAIAEAEKLKLTDNHFYFTLLGVLYENVDARKSREHFETAVHLARTETDKQFIRAKIAKGTRGENKEIIIN